MQHALYTEGIKLLLWFPFLVDPGGMFGLVYSPWERVTTSHHGPQVSLFLLLQIIIIIRPDHVHLQLSKGQVA